MIYGKKNGGHQAFKRVKSLRSSQSDYLFALSRNWVTFPKIPRSTAILYDATRFHVPFWWKMFAPLVWCLPSWSALHGMSETCVKKCAVAMGANVLNSASHQLVVSPAISSQTSRVSSPTPHRP